jgi:hypothetical protein
MASVNTPFYKGRLFKTDKPHVFVFKRSNDTFELEYVDSGNIWPVYRSYDGWMDPVDFDSLEQARYFARVCSISKPWERGYAIAFVKCDIFAPKFKVM